MESIIQNMAGVILFGIIAWLVITIVAVIYHRVIVQQFEEVRQKVSKLTEIEKRISALENWKYTPNHTKCGEVSWKTLKEMISFDKELYVSLDLDDGTVLLCKDTRINGRDATDYIAYFITNKYVTVDEDDLQSLFDSDTVIVRTSQCDIQCHRKVV